MNRFVFADGWHWLHAGLRTLLFYPAGIFVMTLGVLCARMVLGPFSFATDALALTAAATLFPAASGVTAEEVRERDRLLLVVEASGWGIPAGILGGLFLTLAVPAVGPLLDDSGSEFAVILLMVWTTASYAFYFVCAMYTVFAVLSAARDGTGFRDSGRAARAALRRSWRPLTVIYLVFIAAAYLLTLALAWGVSNLSVVTLDQVRLSFLREGAYTWPVLFFATALFLAMATPFAAAMEPERVDVMPEGKGIPVGHLLLGITLLVGAAGGAALYGRFAEASDNAWLLVGVGVIGLLAFIGAMDCFAGRPGRRKWLAFSLLSIALAFSYSVIQSLGADVHQRAAKELGDTPQAEHATAQPHRD